MVLGLKAAPSTPLPIGRLVMIFPVVALSITIVWGLRQATKRM